MIPDCSALAVPTDLPVMVLSDCWLLPGCFLPLFIFEQRYRDMLEVALGSHRMFGIGTRIGDEVEPAMTAGVIHECYQHGDGTSHLVLLGAQRVRVQSWQQQTSYPLAKVERIERDPISISTLEALREEAIQRLPAADADFAPQQELMIKALRAAKDPELACDVLTYHFVRCGTLVPQSMRMTCAVQRFELLITALKAKS